MRQELDAIAGKIEVVRLALRPMQIAGGRLTPLEARRLVAALDTAAAESRMAGRRVQEMLTIIVAHGEAAPAAPPRQALRLVASDGRPATTTRGGKTRSLRTGLPLPPDGEGPRAA